MFKSIYDEIVNFINEVFDILFNKTIQSDIKKTFDEISKWGFILTDIDYNYATAIIETSDYNILIGLHFTDSFGINYHCNRILIQYNITDDIYFIDDNCVFDKTIFKSRIDLIYNILKNYPKY